MIKDLVFKIIQRLEYFLSHLLGKGYGASTIHDEVSQVINLLNGRIPQILVDIGGNIGNYSDEFLCKYSNLNIHIFEPQKINQGKLKQRFNKHANVKILPFALSDSEGKATLFSDFNGSGLASLANRRLEHFNINLNNKEDISIIVFEDYYNSELKGQIIDVVKLDIEGFELFALKGFGNTIQNVRVIQFEFGGCHIDTKTYFQDFWYFFKDLNFDLYRITPIGLQKIIRYVESDEYFSTTNYVAVNKSLSN